MSDLKLTWTDGQADLSIVADDIATDDGLETAVLLSLFLDRRHDGARGWWGDTPEDLIGSRLWLLARENDTPTVLRRAQEYATEALGWMIEDGVAASVSCVATSAPLAPGTSVMNLDVAIVRPTGERATYRYAYNWQAQELLHAV